CGYALKVGSTGCFQPIVREGNRREHSLVTALGLKHKRGRHRFTEADLCIVYLGHPFEKEIALGFHRPQLCQVVHSHQRSRGMFLMYQRNHACLGSRSLGQACKGGRRGLPKSSSDMMLRAGWTWSTSCPLAHIVLLQAAQR